MELQEGASSRASAGKTQKAGALQKLGQRKEKEHSEKEKGKNQAAVEHEGV